MPLSGGVRRIGEGRRSRLRIPSRRDSSRATSADWLNPRCHSRVRCSGTGTSTGSSAALQPAAPCNAPSSARSRPCGRTSAGSRGCATARHKRPPRGCGRSAAASPGTRAQVSESVAWSGSPQVGAARLSRGIRSASSNRGKSCARRQRWFRSRRSAAEARNRAPIGRRCGTPSATMADIMSCRAAARIAQAPPCPNCSTWSCARCAVIGRRGSAPSCSCSSARSTIVSSRIALVQRRFDRALLIGCPDPGWPKRASRVRGRCRGAATPGRFCRTRPAASRSWRMRGSLPPDSLRSRRSRSARSTPSTTFRWRCSPSADRDARRSRCSSAPFSGGDTLPQLRAAMRAADLVAGVAAPTSIRGSKLRRSLRCSSHARLRRCRWSMSIACRSLTHRSTASLPIFEGWRATNILSARSRENRIETGASCGAPMFRRSWRRRAHRRNVRNSAFCRVDAGSIPAA